ncbi:hypothetical protein ACJX0J_022287, partial [Zea mays]
MTTVAYVLLLNISNNIHLLYFIQNNKESLSLPQHKGIIYITSDIHLTSSIQLMHHQNIIAKAFMFSLGSEL